MEFREIPIALLRSCHLKMTPHISMLEEPTGARFLGSPSKLHVALFGFMTPFAWSYTVHEGEGQSQTGRRAG